MTSEPKGLVVTQGVFWGDKREPASLSEADFENVTAHRDFSVINISAINEVINASSKDRLKAWNKYKEGAANRIYDAEVLPRYLQLLKKEMTRKVLVDNLIQHGFPKLTTPTEVTNFMEAKLKYFKNLLEKARTSIASISQKFNISKAEYEKLLKEFDSEKYSNFSGKVSSSLNKDNGKEFKREWGWDFTSIGAGKAFVNHDEYLTSVSWSTADTVYNLCLTNDVVILTHGTNVAPSHNLTKEEADLAQKMQEYLSSTGDKTFKNLELTDAEKAILEKYRKKYKKFIHWYTLQYKSYAYTSIMQYFKDRITGDLKKAWGFGEPLKTPYGTFKDVNECIRACINNGAKKIKILSCNPGHYRIADDIKNMDDVEVDYQINSVWMENANLVIKKRIVQHALYD